MAVELSFAQEIERLEEQLELAEQELAELEERREHYDVQTQECRQSLENLKATLSGRLPRSSRDRHKIQALEVNPESGRPARGSRRMQLEQICKKVGRGGTKFRTLDILEQLRQIEGKLTEGMKSYTYAVLAQLRDEGFLEKLGRGTWKLNS